MSQSGDSKDWGSPVLALYVPEGVGTGAAGDAATLSQVSIFYGCGGARQAMRLDVASVSIRLGGLA